MVIAGANLVGLKRSAVLVAAVAAAGGYMTPWHGYVDRRRFQGLPVYASEVGRSALAQCCVRHEGRLVDIQTSALSLSYTGCTLMHIT